MKKLTIPIVLGLLCLSFWARGQGEVEFTSAESQTVTNSAELKVGDRVPKSFWTYQHQFLMDGKVYKKDLSEYKGKWLVLNFWATSCGGCIENLPSYSNLQKKFSEKAQFIMVNSYEKIDSLEKLVKFYRDYKDKASIEHLSNVILDSELKRLFPHRFVAHNIWIDKRGIVRAISGADFLKSVDIGSLY